MRIEKIDLKQIAIFENCSIEFPISLNKDMAEVHIFTGPNGSGKSTILYGLAGAFQEIDKHYSTDSINRFHKRYKYFEGECEKDCGSEAYIYFENSQFVQIYGCSKCKFIHAKTKNTQIKDYYSYGNKVLSFAAFAYSGYRFVERENINMISEAKNKGLNNALEFIKNQDDDSLTLNQWLANNISKRDIAFQQKNVIAAERYQQNLQDIERVISEIIGYKITFSLQLEPLNLVIKTQNSELDFDVLPDGLRSLISWIGDLLMRMDGLKWENDLPIAERRFFLFLDEIEVHLHPEWQRKVLPIVQKLFKNAQIFISTHSPFVVNSIDNAWIHEIELENGVAKVNPPILSNSGDSYMRVLREVFGIKDSFGGETKINLGHFYDMRNQILASPNGIDSKLQQSFLEISEKLAAKSTELNTIVQGEIRQINRIKTTEFVV